jgi:hypothetical protein
MGIGDWLRSLWWRLLLALLVPVVLLAVLAILSWAGQISGTAAAVTAALLFAVALLGMFYYQGRAIGRLESGKPEKVAEIERARESAEREKTQLQSALAEVQTLLEEERTKRRETDVRLQRERGRFLSVTNLQPILDVGVMEVTFNITEAYDLAYDKNWNFVTGVVMQHPHEDDSEKEEKEGEGKEQEAECGEPKYRFLGALTTEFTGRFGFDLHKVRGEFDDRAGVVRFLIPSLEFLGPKSFSASEWGFSYMLRQGGIGGDLWLLAESGSNPEETRKCSGKEKEICYELQADLHNRLRKGAAGPDKCLSKSLERLGTTIVHALMLGTTGIESSAVESLSGPGKPLLELIRDLAARESEVQGMGSMPRLPEAAKSFPANRDGMV